MLAKELSSVTLTRVGDSDHPMQLTGTASCFGPGGSGLYTRSALLPCTSQVSCFPDQDS